MALHFDGMGYVTLASQWVPTNPLNFEFEIELSFPGNQGYNVWASPIGEGSLKGSFRVGNDKYMLYYEGSVGGVYFKYLTDNVTYASDVKIRVKLVSSNAVEIYLNDAATPTETLTLDAGKEWVTWHPTAIGYRNPSSPELMPAGSKINSVKFTDLETPANSSIYLFNDGSGTTLTDSGPLGNHGTLVGFSDLNAAWGIQGPSITAADNITTEGQSATFTLSGNTAAPTSATLNGVDVGTLADQGSAIHSYTAPLIADDDTANLVVSVDGTTASATISYANSLPYALTDHGEPEVNSVMYGNQFGTTGAVELAEPQLISGEAQAATIDWAAMDSAQGWTADINNYATVSGDGEQVWEFTYLVAETNETGTFQRTLQIGDGGIVIERTLTRSLVRSLAGRSLRRKL